MRLIVHRRPALATDVELDRCNRPLAANFPIVHKLPTPFLSGIQAVREICGDELCTVGAQWGILVQRAPANMLIYLKLQSILASS